LANGGRPALVFADLGETSLESVIDDVRATPKEISRVPPLVLAVEIGVQVADRDRLDALWPELGRERPHRRLVERVRTLPRPSIALGTPNPQLARHQRRRLAHEMSYC